MSAASLLSVEKNVILEIDKMNAWNPKAILKEGNNKFVSFNFI